MCSLVCTLRIFPFILDHYTINAFFMVFNLCLYMSNLMNCQIKLLLTKRFGLHIGNVYIGWPVAYLEFRRDVLNFNQGITSGPRRDYIMAIKTTLDLFGVSYDNGLTAQKV